MPAGRHPLRQSGSRGRRVAGRAADLVVIGGGIIGLAIAREAARAGLRVTVLDRGVPGGEASTAAAGILSAQYEAGGPHPLLPFLLHSRSLYPAFLRAVGREGGLEVRIRPAGTIQVARNGAEMARLERHFVFQRSMRLPVERLSRRRLLQIEPGLVPGLAGGLLLPRDGGVDSVRLLAALQRAAARAGVRIHAGTPATRLMVAGGAVIGVASGSRRFPAGAVVIAAGAWSGAFSPPGAPPLPAHPIRGQILCLRAGRAAPRHVIDSEAGYLVPRADGRVLVGSTMERVGFRKAVTASGLAGLTRVAAELVPGLRDTEIIGAWSGLRPATADGLPAIGAAEVPGLYYATGHLRNGIVLAPATARVVVRLLLGEPLEVDLEPFSPRRFSAAPAASGGRRRMAPRRAR